MIDQLHQMAIRLATRAIDPRPLRHHADWLSSPAAAMAFAMELAALVRPALPARGRSVAEDGAVDLLTFISQLPRSWLDEIATYRDFPTGITRAWHEANPDAWVSLCSLVQDVWEHLFGPETDDDPIIAAALLAERPRRAIDFGAGAGHFTMVLARGGTEVIAIESNSIKRAFLLARATAEGLEGRIRLVDDLGQATPCELLMAINVLDHLERPDLVVPLLAERVVAGGRLFHVSAFPTDGFHQSDEAVVSATLEALLEAFTPDDKVFGPETFLEVLRKAPARARYRPGPVAPGAHGLLVPRVHPALRSLAIDDGERVALFARRFYVRPCYVDQDTLAILERFDGQRTIDSVCVEEGLPIDTLWPLVEEMWRQGVLTIQANGEGDVASCR